MNILCLLWSAALLPPVSKKSTLNYTQLHHAAVKQSCTHISDCSDVGKEKRLSLSPVAQEKHFQSTKPTAFRLAASAFLSLLQKNVLSIFLDTFSAPSPNKDERQQAEFRTANKPESSLLCIHLWKSPRKLSLISFLSWIMVSKKELNSHKKNEAEAIHCLLISLYFLQNT